MKKISTFLMFIVSFFISCSSSKQGKVIQGKDGKIESAVITAKCTPPQKSYAREIESKLKAEMDSLRFSPSVTFDASFNQKVIKLREYSSKGLDLDLLTFRICEMANNRGFTSEQTSTLIEKAIKMWSEGEAKQSAMLQQTIISNDQKGGITAGVVYLDGPKRKLDLIGKERLLTILNPLKFDAIDISSSMGDAEAYNFAIEIFNFLKSNYSSKKIDDVGQAIYSKPITGVSIDTSKLIVSKNLIIIVGSKG